VCFKAAATPLHLKMTAPDGQSFTEKVKPGDFHWVSAPQGFIEWEGLAPLLQTIKAAPWTSRLKVASK
jgi:hypothetical protein